MPASSIVLTKPAPSGGVEKIKYIPFSFNGVLPDTSTVAQLIIPDPDLVLQTSGHIAKSIIAPAGDDAVIDITKNGAVIGDITFADGSSTGTITVTTAVSFVAGDILSLSTNAINGMESPVISLKLEKT